MKSFFCGLLLFFLPASIIPEVNSFDIFDTLVGRFHFYPDSIFEQVEKNYPFPNFTVLRKYAEQLSNGTLPDIYKKLKVLSKLDNDQISKLMKFEIETEMNELFPISENLSLVKDSDLLISDSYYDLGQIKQLLRKIGFTKDVAIHVSPAGKSSGTIWQKAKKENWGIALHTGDNAHSDVKMALAYNIPAKHYANSQLTNMEKSVVHMGSSDLAYLMRALRLQNPYPVHSAGYAIWKEQTQTNIPLLIECSLYLDEFCKTHRKKRILFSTRDCCLWKPLFEAMFPLYESIDFHTSRYVYLNPSPSYIEYVRSIYTKECAIVDGQGSGDTCISFFKKHLNNEPTYLAIVNVDMLQFRSAAADILKIPRYGIVKTSDGYSDKIEKINADLIGSLKDYKEGKPIRIAPEHPSQFVLPAHECMKKCLELLPHYSIKKFDRKILCTFLRQLEKEAIMPNYLQHIGNHFLDIYHSRYRLETEKRLDFLSR